jgi:hypothetical protein
MGTANYGTFAPTSSSSLGKVCGLFRVALGHSSAQMTPDVYGHLWPEPDDAMWGAVDSVWVGYDAPDKRLRT